MSWDAIRADDRVYNLVTSAATQAEIALQLVDVAPSVPRRSGR
jgi:hypothetical protein